MKRHWNRINWLSSMIAKKLLGQLSKEENEELESILCDKNILKSGGKFKNTSFIAERLVENPTFNTKKSYEDFRIKTGKSNIRFLYNTMFKYVAVAIVLIFITISYFVISDKQILNDNSFKQMIIPNKNVILKLASGEEFSLNQKGSVITEKNGTKLIVDSGKLCYNRMTNGSKELLYNEIKVPRGGEYFLELADGTSVWINSESTIKYPVNFVGKEREVLIEGEAFFDVAKNKNKPFIVKTSMGKITVLGTEFNIRDYKEENKMVATLVKGEIRYVDMRVGINPRIIEPGYQMIASKGYNEIKYGKVDVKEFVGWKDGLYIFKDKSLEEIMNTIERWYDVRIIFINGDLKKLRFSGDLKRFSSINTLLDLIEMGGDVCFERNKNVIKVMEKDK